MKTEKFGENGLMVTFPSSVFCTGPYNLIPEIDQVIFNPPRTIVNWSDGTKTIVKVMEGDEFDEHVGFQAAVTRKVFGGHSQYKRLIEDAHRTSPEMPVRKDWRVLGDDEVMQKDDIVCNYADVDDDYTADGWAGSTVNELGGYKDGIVEKVIRKVKE